MKILLVHNRYRTPGGEDAVFDREKQALTDAGERVFSYAPETPPTAAAALQALQAAMGCGHLRACKQILQTERPDILHAHNLFPLLSPRLFPTAKRLNVKTVLTLHNFRPLCLNGLFLTPSHEICERCAPGNFWPGIWRGCYRGSQVQSAALALHVSAARRLGWYDAVNLFIAPSEFLKEHFVRQGFPENRIQVQKPFLADRPEIPTPNASSSDLLYLGRLSQEKGVRWLIETVQNSGRDIALDVAGDGPLRSYVESVRSPRIRYHGHVVGEKKRQLMNQALAVVMASECYENAPLVIPEANAYGVPCLVPNQGGMAEQVIPGTNGERFTPKDSYSFWQAYDRLADASTRADRRQKAASHAQKTFAQESWLKRRLSLYESLL